MGWLRLTPGLPRVVGWCWQNRDRDQPTHPHMLGHADCAQVFRQAITHPLTPHPHGPDGPDVKFEVVYGVSDSNWCALS